MIYFLFTDVPSPPTAPLEMRQIAANTMVIEWGRPESDGGAPLESYKIAIRDAKKTMWMEVGRVSADIQKLNIRDLQENHEYLVRIFARNEIGFSDHLESEEPFKIVPTSGTIYFLIIHFLSYLFLQEFSLLIWLLFREYYYYHTIFEIKTLTNFISS